MFSGGREKMHWEQMGLFEKLEIYWKSSLVSKISSFSQNLMTRKLTGGLHVSFTL